MPPTVYGLAGPSSRQDGAGRTQQAGHSRQDTAGRTREGRERASSSLRTNSTVQYFQKILCAILVFFIVENEVFLVLRFL